MKEQLISFETAKLAKYKGFNELVDSVYNIVGVISNNINNKNQDWENNEIYSAPTQSLLQKWLREIKNIHIYIIPYFGTEYDEGVQGWELLTLQHLDTEISKPIRIRFETYEEALEKGLQEVLQIIE